MSHSITSNMRENVRVTGALEVLSFDDAGVVCTTELGVLAIKGANLRVLNLNTDTGVLDVVGVIDSLAYADKHQKGKQSILGRIFK